MQKQHKNSPFLQNPFKKLSNFPSFLPEAFKHDDGVFLPEAYLPRLFACNYNAGNRRRDAHKKYSDNRIKAESFHFYHSVYSSISDASAAASILPE